MRSFYLLVLLLISFPNQAGAEETQFQSEEVTFRSAGDVLLSGSLTLPGKQGPYPAIVMIGGSERMDRKSMYHWANADAYVSQGIAVFCFDSPGTGKSEGNRFGRTHRERAEDALASIKTISQREDINDKLVGIYGASEGGVVVFRVASHMQSLAFAIAVAAPTTPDYQDINHTVESLARDYGLKGVEIEKLVTFNHLASDLVRNHSTIDYVELKKKVASWDEPGWSKLLSLVQKRTNRNREATKDSFIAIVQQWNGEEWFRGTEMLLGFWKQVATRLEVDLAALDIDFDDKDIAKVYVELFYAVGTSKIAPDPSRDEDPVSFLRKIECPVLCVYGERDPLAKGAEIIQEAFADINHGDYFVKIVPQAGHQLKISEGGHSERHKGIDKFILNWVQQRVRQK